MRYGFTFSLPKKLVAIIDSKRGLATRSAYLTNILANLYNIGIQPYPGQKVSSPDLNMVGESIPSTPTKEPMIDRS
jgi:hypothetical protein